MGSHMVYEDILSRSNGPFFRLLTVSPSASRQSVIECELATSPLFGNIEYEALSYCWGDAHDTRAIQCNGKTFNVTANLKSALIRLRKDDVPRVLWVDAVCIDQSNLAERASQVSHMRSIYKRAAQVLVWLGPEDEGSDHAFPLCERIARNWSTVVQETGPLDGTRSVIREVKEEWARTSLIASYPRLEQCWGNADEQSLRRDFKELLTQHEENRDPGGLLFLDITREDGTPARVTIAHTPFDEFLAFLKVIRRAWWTRSWVVQEICLAKKALMICGDVTIDWDVFSTAIVVMNSEANNPFLGLLSNDYALSLIKLITTLNLTNTSIDILDMLWQFRSLQATDPRDKLHAFLGLMPQDDPVHQHVRPNYEIDMVKCYTGAAWTCMSLRQNLDLLATARYPFSGLGPSLPSWVPDWSFADPHTTPLPLEVTRSGAKAPQPFAASGPCATYTPQEDKDQPGTLPLSGLVLDQLEALEDPLPPVGEVYGTFFGSEDEMGFKMMKSTVGSVGEYYDALIKWERFAVGSTPVSKDSLVYGTGKDDLLRVFCATMCAGDMPNGADEMYKSFQLWRANQKWPKRIAKLNRLAGNRLRRGLGYPLMGYFGMGVKPPGEATEDAGFFSQTQVAGSRRLARTAKGYLALIPKHAQAGDRVVLCRGSKLPLILRPTHGNQWELVGCSYVHGIMHGEAWREDGCEEFRLV